MYAYDQLHHLLYTEEEGGGFSGRCLELPGAISQGETLDAVQLILSSINEEAQEKKKMVIEVSV